MRAIKPCRRKKNTNKKKAICLNILSQLWRTSGASVSHAPFALWKCNATHCYVYVLFVHSFIHSFSQCINININQFNLLSMRLMWIVSSAIRTHQHTSHQNELMHWHIKNVMRNTKNAYWIVSDTINDVTKIRERMRHRYLDTTLHIKCQTKLRLPVEWHSIESIYLYVVQILMVVCFTKLIFNDFIAIFIVLSSKGQMD